MRITKVVFQNYRVYAGKQELDLTPREDGRPVALVGGLNGEGKTTLLEGIQLGLYGRRSELWRHSASSYSDYLLQSIHRAANPASGAMVQVEFAVARPGGEETFKVQRIWRRNGGAKAEEHVQVFVDGELDRGYSEDWADQVERIVPARLAGLFFFDGEKIKHYAEAQRSRELLERGVQSLLGIDVVDQLDIDLKALEARIAKAEKGNDDDQARKQLEQEVADRTAEVDRLSEQIASLRTEADRLERRYDTFDRHYAEAGGELYDRHKELDAERKGLDARLRAAKDVLIGLSGSALPFALVPNLLARTQLQMRVEIEVTGARTALERLDDQQDRLLDRLSGRRVAARTKASIEDFFREERVELEKVAEVPAYLGSSHEDYLSASSLTEQKLPELESQAHDALQNYEELESRLEQLDRQLASVPDKAAIADLRAQREAAKHELAVTIGKIEQTQEDLRLAKVHLQEAEQSLHKHLVEQFEKRSEVEDRARVMKHAERVRGTLASFRARLIKRRVAQLERLILESYVDLMRKSGMVSRISIDPETFELSLFNSEGTRVLPDWLSAGERQLLVVSILWGLARASGRSLPVIVDTPLGRLDSLHRDNLVKHYFPHASHQVILLSTDEEIIGHTLRALEPAIGHKYRLVYDDDADATRIEPGYFKEQVSAN